MPVFAVTIDVAVAANFSAPIHMISTHFKKETGHVARISLGANKRKNDLILKVDTDEPGKAFDPQDQR